VILKSFDKLSKVDIFSVWDPFNFLGDFSSHLISCESNFKLWLIEPLFKTNIKGFSLSGSSGFNTLILPCAFKLLNFSFISFILGFFLFFLFFLISNYSFYMYCFNSLSSFIILICLIYLYLICLCLFGLVFRIALF
jgi:hypothetical protein